MIRILLTVPSLRPEYGGPAASVLGLGRSLARAGMDVHIATLEAPEDLEVPLPGPRITVIPALRSERFRVSWSPRWRSRVAAICREEGVSLVHDNGIWQPPHHDVATLARRTGLPLVVSPRGMLEPWAAARKATKKKIAWSLYQRRDLGAAACFHATSIPEAEHLRQLGFTQPIAVVPNGVEAPAGERPTAPRTRRLALFLSRITPKKGLPGLVRAWSRVRPPGWDLVVAGPDEEGHRHEVETEVRDLGLEQVVRFVGPVFGGPKWELYRSSDLFLLPTHSENFGMAIAEAMAAGLPVLTTKAAPWPAIFQERCGWWIDDTPEALQAALRESTSLDDRELQERGRHGRAYVERMLGWASIGSDMADVYLWLLGQGSRPGNVR